MELHRVAIVQLGHIATMHKVLSMRKDKLPDVLDMDGTQMFDKDLLHDNFYDKLWDMVKLFQEKGFLSTQLSTHF